MSGKGKSFGKGISESKKKQFRSTQSNQAGLIFSVSRVARFAKRGRYAERIGKQAPVYIAAVLEYTCQEIIELALDKAESLKKKRLYPRAIMLAIKEDPELNELFKNASFHNAGVVPNFNKNGNDKKKKQQMNNGHPNLLGDEDDDSDDNDNDAEMGAEDCKQEDFDLD